VRQLLAVQAQDLGSARLALRARRPGLDANEIAEALRGRALVISWLCRGTLHLVAAEDWSWLLTLTAQEGVSASEAERALAAIKSALAEAGPLTRDELRSYVSAARVRSEGQAMIHVLRLAAFRGLIVACDEARYALAHDWLPQQKGVEPEAALQELAVRYRRGHACASPEDLARWAGITLREARTAWRGTREPEVEPLALPRRLLPPFDPYLLGWAERGFAVPDHLRKRVFPGGGMLRATALQDGQVVGTWTRRGGRVQLTDGADASQFAAEIEDVERFLGC
jgi:hypothetical protein